MSQNRLPNFSELYKMPYKIQEDRISDYFSLLQNRAFEILKERKLLQTLRERPFETLNEYKCSVLALMQNEYYSTLRSEAKKFENLLHHRDQIPLQFWLDYNEFISQNNRFIVLQGDEEHGNEHNYSKQFWKYNQYKDYLSFQRAKEQLVILLIRKKGSDNLITQPALMVRSRKNTKNGSYKITNFYLPFIGIIKGQFKNCERLVYVQPINIFASYRTELDALITLSENNRFTQAILDPLELNLRAIDNLQSELDDCQDIVAEQPNFNTQFNEQEQEAIGQAVDYTQYITFIDGPPGTGKTECSLGILQIFEQRMQTQQTQNEIILLLGHSNTVVNDLVRKIQKDIRKRAEILNRENKIKVIRIGRADRCDENLADLSLDYKCQNAFFHKHLNDDLKYTLSQMRYINQNRRKVFRSGQYNLIQLLEYIETYIRTQNPTRKWVEDHEDIAQQMYVLLGKNHQEYQKIQSSILSQYNVVVSTLNASASFVMKQYLRDKKIRMCIVDEAPTASETALLIPIANYPIEKLVLLGDVKQLGINCNSAESKYEKGAFDQSCYERLIKIGFDEDQNPDAYVHEEEGYSKINLPVQYRQMENLASITSKFFYENKLVNDQSIYNMQYPAEYSQLIKSQNNCLFFNVIGGKEQRSFTKSQSNEIEAKAIVRLVDYLTQNQPRNVEQCKKEISIISAYREQFQTIKALLSQKDLMKFVELDTIDGFQGKENLFVIISLVRTQKMGFLINQRRCNVALSRAKYGQFIFGNEKLLLEEGVHIWKDIINYFNEKSWIRDYREESAHNLEYYKRILTRD